jgi:hypothetical protein
MLSVSVEGLPPSIATKTVSPSGLGVADPAVSAPGCSQAPSPIPDSAAPASQSLEVLIGLSDLDILKLLEQLQGQVTGPVPTATTYGLLVG